MRSRERDSQNKPETKTIRVPVTTRNRIREFAAYKKFTMKEAVEYLIRKAVMKLNGE